MRGLIRMVRPMTLPQSAALVAYGAYGARGVVPLCANAGLQLCLSTLAAGAVTSSSMLSNDLADFRRGVDTARSQPTRPLVTGQVEVATAAGALHATYLLLLLLLCCLANVRARLILLCATLVTHYYTEHLKPLLLLKNVACAAVVAAAPAMGAVAVSGQLRTALRPALVIVCVITHREILMDIDDREGDAAAGLQTLATTYGPTRALALAALPLAAAATLARTQRALLILLLQAAVSFFSSALAVQTAPLILAAALLRG
jgi:4-hydroxybenzoate polyprenyltransferase